MRILFASFLLVLGIGVFAQNDIAVTGKVTEKGSGEPLIGVAVVVEGTQNGTVTSLDGGYTIQKVPKDANLIFTYIGYKNITRRASQVVNVEMEDNVFETEEVVVIGYGTAKKRDLTGSIASVNATQLANKPSINPLASIQGLVSGAQVVTNGRPGQDPEVRIRGTNSVNGYKPLYVVDGLLTDNINYLNPADIETMDILKDPSSLAIFGVRGANGVIAITTKKAKEGTSVNINTSLGFKTVVNKVKLTDAFQFRELYTEQRANQGITIPYDYTNWNANTDWQDEMFRSSAAIYTTNVSVSGAGERGKTYLGIGHVYEEGSVRNEKYKRFSINFNHEYQLASFLKVGIQLTGARTLPADTKSIERALQAAPIAPVYNEQYGLYYSMPDFQRAQIQNPMMEAEILANTKIEKNYRGSGSVFGEIKFLKDFTFKVTFSADIQANQARGYLPLIAFYNPDVEGGIEEKAPYLTSVWQSKENLLTAQSDYLLSYKKKYKMHSFDVTAGLSTNYNEYSSLNAGRGQKPNGYPISNDKDSWYISIGDADTSSNGSNQWERFMMSFLFRTMYNYKSKYLLNVSYRRDGSSLFYKTGNTWDDFYSFGAGWVMSEENFMKHQKVVDYLKIKASYGVLGSDATGTSNPYPAYPNYENGSSAVFGDNIIFGQGPAYLADPNLHWEKTKSWEVGIELYILANRLKIEPVYYHKRTEGILTTIPGPVGTTPGLKNVGTVENKGFELTLNWKDKIGDFEYSIGGNLTTIKNKVVSLVNPKYNIIDGPSWTLQGYPIGSFYGYVVEGVYQNYRDIFDSPITTFEVNPGDLKYKDLNNDNKIDDQDRTMIGNPTPDFTYGLNINLSYKNFDLGIDFMGVYGNEIFRMWGSSSYAQLNYRSVRMNRWHGEGTSNWEPILDPSRANNSLASTYNIEDGSFFRLRNVQLGYTLHRDLQRMLHLKSLRIFANVQNPFTWKKNSAYTPEISGSAIRFGVDDGNTYPVSAVYTFGLNIVF